MNIKLALIVNRRLFSLGFEAEKVEDDDIEVATLETKVGFTVEDND